MAAVRLSQAARADLREIGAYTLQTWGKSQARRYLAALRHSFSMLANAPELGRPCDSIRPGLRRIEQGSHIVFYRQRAGAIVISRILHRGMQAAGRQFPQ